MRWRDVDRLARVLLACLAVALVVPAHAHTRSESHSSWEIDGDHVRLSVTLPDIETKRLAAPDEISPSDARLIVYLTPHLAVLSGTEACVLSAKRPIASIAGYRKFGFDFSCASAAHLSIRFSGLFEIVPNHVNFAQIRLADGRLIEQLFTNDRQTIDLDSAGPDNRLESAGFLTYVGMGIWHILTGVDHQSFLLGLVLISRRLRDLVFVVTGFTIGHSITLALAVTGLMLPHAEYIDALVGLTIVLIGAENFGDMTHRPFVMAVSLFLLLTAMALLRLMGAGGLPPFLLFGAALFSGSYLMLSGHMADAARFRLIVTLVFGLIHGFGFAADLLEMKLPADRLAELLVGFNLGVEIAQLALVAAVVGLATLAIRLRCAAPRPILVDLGSSCLVAIGTYWFVSRSYS